MIDLGRRTTLLAAAAATALALAACEDNTFDPANVSSFSVDLDISGTPGSGAYQLEWENPDGPGSGGAPLNPELLPKVFDQIPIGSTRVSLVETPTGCSVGDPVRTIQVERGTTAPVVFTVSC